MISFTYIGSINLCIFCVFVVRSNPSLGRMYLRIHFTHQTQESHFSNRKFSKLSQMQSSKRIDCSARIFVSTKRPF
ncbi:hypothetical protein EZJ55_06655 [Microcystis aeruginosa EAWAG127a]|uniref:Uncharacterized protein n=1 Tax=Microcystis aeruginosa EAWAG127a TaxID=2529855 RepID=A0A5J5LRR9_MICAE|nr:hypothetical protein EZJ55_06655 [Microcystis aeruginosa EAWAG127a]